MGIVSIIRQLLDASASVEARQDSETALIITARNGHALLANIFIDYGVNLDAVSDDGTTALMAAAAAATDAVVKVPFEALKPMA